MGEKLATPPRLIDTPAFKEWFAGSKLQDALGNPLVLYHGSRPGTDITEFEARHETDGIYFTPDPLYAEGFTNELFTDDERAGAIFPVYLSIKNPKVVVADDGDDDWLAFVDRGFNRLELIEQGFDGAILVEASTGIIDQVQAYYPHQIKSAIGNSGTFDPSVADIRYSRQDPRYLFAGPQAETSDLLMLDKARLMEQNKRPAPYIFKETGWLRGPDGQWRYEISDHDARLKIGIPQAIKDDAFNRVYQEAEFEQDTHAIKAIYHRNDSDYLATWGRTKEEAAINLADALAKRDFTGYRSVADVENEIVELGDILDHPRLFAAYPRLRDLLVHFDPNMSDAEKGEFSWGRGITVNARMSAGEILSTLLHEVQHSIQSAEGFARGGSPEERFTGNVKSMLTELSTEHRRQVDQWITSNIFVLDAHQKASDLLTYGLMYQSARRLREYANRDRPSGVLRLIKDECSWAYHDMVRQHPEVRRKFDELDRNWMSLPKRHRQVARNLFIREQCSEAADLLDQVIPAEVLKNFRADERQLRSMIKALEREASRAREKLAPLRELEKAERAAKALKERHEYSTGFQIYRSLAGEIEARNTQTRQIMTPEERRQTPPELTADIKRDEAIVVMRGREGSTVEIPHQMANVTPLGYLRSASTGGNRLTVEDAQYWCNRLLGSWKGRPDIHVVSRISELPTPLQKDIWTQRAARDVRAAFWKDNIYILAPRIENRNKLEEVLLHEIVGHYGLRALLGDHLEPTLERIYQDMGTDPIAEQIKAIYFGNPPFDATNPEHRQLVAEEMMAKLAETAEYRAISEWERFESQTRNGLRQMGFQLPLQKADLLNILYGAEQVVRNGGLSLQSSDYIPQTHTPAFRQWFGQSKVVDEAGLPLVVYHGTGSDFSVFKPSEGGTLGGGMYFTSSPEKASEFAQHKAAPDIVDTDDGGFELVETDQSAAVMPVYLKMENPIYARDMALTDGIAEVKAKGHDGIIFNDYFVVFEPEQVKSAIGNSGSFQPDNPDIRFLRTFHGSPHKFDRFSLAAIGSGEGAQGYGWGLYFAGNREIAEYYREVLKGHTQIKVRDQLYRSFGELFPEASGIAKGKAASAFKRANGDIDETLRLLHENYEIARDLGTPERVQRAKDILDEAVEIVGKAQAMGAEVVAPDSYLYEVEIPDDSDLLDRDAPLNQQPDSVKEKLATIDFPLTSTTSYAEQIRLGLDPFDSNTINAGTGADLQAAIAKAADEQTFNREGPIWDMVKDDPNRLNYNLSQLTSMYLNSVGIPGLRYRDGGSRTREADATFNYVIWDESVVSVQAVNDEMLQAEHQARHDVVRYSRTGSPSSWIPEYAERRIQELADQVESAYASGDLELAETLDAELEESYDALEHYLLQAEEDGVAELATNFGQQHPSMARWLHYTGSVDDAEVSLSDVLADTYEQFVDPACWLDRDAAITNGRSNIELFGGSTQGVSDDQVLDAMKDAYEHSGARLAAKRPSAQSAFGRDTNSFLSSLKVGHNSGFRATDPMANSILAHMDDTEIRMMLKEEKGIDAAGLTRGNLVILAEQHGIHTIQNDLFRDLIQISLDRWAAGRDSATEALSMIENKISQGAYDYDELAVEKLRQAVKLQQALASPAMNDPAHPSPEACFRAFLNQELAYQESCLEVAVQDSQADMVSARREQKAYKDEIASLRRHLGMLDAGMTVEQIRANGLQNDRRSPSINSSAVQVSLIEDHLKKQAAYHSAITPGEEESAGPRNSGP